MNLSDAVEDLYTRCPGVPEALLVTSYRDATRRFLRRVRGWVIDSTYNSGFTQGATSAEYVATLPPDAELVDFLYPRYLATDLERMTYDQMVGRGWPDVGSVRGARLSGVNTIVVAPDPEMDISADFSARLVLRPTRDATTIPDDVVIRYADALEYGALSLIYTVPNTAVTSMNAANYYRELFNDQIDLYEAQAADGNMRGINRAVRYYSAGSR